MVEGINLVFVQIGLVALLAFYLAACLGANDVANSMGTSVGSKALTLTQAIIVAGILEFTGAVLFSGKVSSTLATGVVNPTVFLQKPQIFALGMVSVLISCGLWLQLASSKGLPVASSHAVVGAIAGFSSVEAGLNSVNWSTIGQISLGWLIAPLVSCIFAGLFYSLIKHWIVDHPDPRKQLQEWIPWLSVALMTVFGVIVLPKLSAAFAGHIGNYIGLKIPVRGLSIAIGAIATISLTLISWRKLSTTKEIDSRKYPNLIESHLAHFQVLSACFVAFAHGSNDVGNAVAPLAAIAYIFRTGLIPLTNFDVPVWILLVGGGGIVTGLAIWGKNVISTVGENIISLQPSGGFCAELATATTVLVASRIGLPVSTSHALIGAVVGIGLVNGLKSIRFQTVGSIALAWLITIPVASGLSAIIFSLLVYLFG
ncbi:MAG: inorganic phosphate transporter [Microcoleaceae cyanobacterium MO_207.B10]|nr:inorganic phosphate transporter [Microcoleaceae cyanobacterium MO_207.B10]